MRRNRRTAWSRALVRENTLTAHDLIWPVFVIEGQNRTEAVASMPGVTRYSVDLIVDKVKEAADLGIPAIALFPNTPRELRTADAREAFNPQNLVCQAVRAIRTPAPLPLQVADTAPEFALHPAETALPFGFKRGEFGIAGVVHERPRRRH